MNDQNDFFDDLIDDEADTNDSALLDYDEEDEDETIDTRTVVLTKNGMIALLSLRTSASGAQVVRIDPRQALPTAQNYDDSDAALKWFRRSIATSRKNGWEVVYNGAPMFG
ncbi:MAG TPA: hypothetical protein VF666_12420 [Pyrinomonadaceae bacterium]|jgi:hypothetical protein